MTSRLARIALYTAAIEIGSLVGALVAACVRGVR